MFTTFRGLSRVSWSLESWVAYEDVILFRHCIAGDYRGLRLPEQTLPSTLRSHVLDNNQV